MTMVEIDAQELSRLQAIEEAARGLTNGRMGWISKSDGSGALVSCRHEDQKAIESEFVNSLSRLKRAIEGDRDYPQPSQKVAGQITLKKTGTSEVDVLFPVLAVLAGVIFAIWVVAT